MQTTIENTAIIQLKHNSCALKALSMARKKQPPPPPPSLAPAQPTFRSGAVARMADMPVSTLRIWEQRYQAVKPVTARSGHRLYSSADVERVVLLRQLTGFGHAIGALAGLDIGYLRNVAITHSTNEMQALSKSTRRKEPLRIVVVGQAMARRLQRPAVVRRLGRPLQVVGVFSLLAEAAHAAALSTDAAVDLLLWQTSGLQVGALPELKAAQDAWRARCVAVAYRFAGAGARDALAGTGALLAREPAGDDALRAWLASLEPAVVEDTDVRSNAGLSASTNVWSLHAMGSIPSAVPARRFDDVTLTEFAGLSSTVACECPSHVAELLMQISGFEAYSRDCADRSPADAQLHAYLQRVAGGARLLFEAALERVAVAEGITLP
jgi:MerR family transcriptional regulator, light-induced transcriptional regulator